MLIKNIFKHILELAIRQRSTKTKTHQIFAIVGPLLSFLGKLLIFYRKVKASNDNINFIDMQVLTSFFYFFIKINKPYINSHKADALNITHYFPNISIEILPTHLYSYSNTFFYFNLDKQIDYTIGLSLSLLTLEILQDIAYNTTTKSVNQTLIFYNFIFIFVNIEVKKKHVLKNPAIQLEFWIAAKF